MHVLMDLNIFKLSAVCSHHLLGPLLSGINSKEVNNTKIAPGDISRLRDAPGYGLSFLIPGLPSCCLLSDFITRCFLDDPSFLFVARWTFLFGSCFHDIIKYKDTRDLQTQLRLCYNFTT